MFKIIVPTSKDCFEERQNDNMCKTLFIVPDSIHLGDRTIHCLTYYLGEKGSLDLAGKETCLFPTKFIHEWLIQGTLAYCEPCTGVSPNFVQYIQLVFATPYVYFYYNGYWTGPFGEGVLWFGESRTTTCCE